MKRMLCLLVAVMLCGAVAQADTIDLSGLSLDELIDLQYKVNAAIWARDGWQMVTVPQGLYKVGVDIPSGKWQITCAPGDTTSLRASKCRVTWGDTLSADGNEIEYSIYNYGWVNIDNVDSIYHQQGATVSYVLDLKKGYYVHIEPGFGAAVFQSYTGPVFQFDDK